MRPLSWSPAISSTPMDADELSRRLGRARRSVFRLETLDAYDSPAEAESLAAFRAGSPRPERSLVTSGYLRMVARSVLAGRQWSRIHVADMPLSEYLRYQLAGYLENAAVGEEIAIASRSAHPGLAELEDFYLLDEGFSGETVILLGYTRAGEFTGARAGGPADVARCRAAKALAWRFGVPLAACIALRDRQPAA